MSRFLKCTRSDRRRARGSAGRGSGPGCPSPPARWRAGASSPSCSGGRRRSGRRSATGAYAVVHDRVAPVGDHVPGHRHRGDPVRRGRPRTPTGRRRKRRRPQRQRPRAWPHASLDDDRPVHERVDQAVELVLARLRRTSRCAASAAASPSTLSSTPVFQNPLPCSVGVRAGVGAADRSGTPPPGRTDRRLDVAASLPRYESGLRSRGCRDRSSPCGPRTSRGASGTSASCRPGRSGSRARSRSTRRRRVPATPTSTVPGRAAPCRALLRGLDGRVGLAPDAPRVLPWPSGPSALGLTTVTLPFMPGWTSQ